ncbi:uncharacterized protein LOC122738296 [Dromiciops gliroides]|uniref:uncharacterized protein LOC122738296 n=1 Tax=Dromiciops gliroides TaxID=33562 RepID=UPI001CC53861|nr:uncharacterized protein LOC122738296 [Dromiciops gliroides]
MPPGFGPNPQARGLIPTVEVPSTGTGLGSRGRQGLVSTQVLSGVVSTAQFFLYEAFLGQHFEAVDLGGNEPEPGDLFLFRLTSPVGQWLGAHVGVYCGHGEIIHFEGRPPPGPQAFLGPWEGMVSKQGRRQLLRSRSLWRVLRRKGGVDRKALKRRVQEAMDADSLPYHPTHSNCVHFALTLLGQETLSVDVDVTSHLDSGS